MKTMNDLCRRTYLVDGSFSSIAFMVNRVIAGLLLLVSRSYVFFQRFNVRSFVQNNFDEAVFSIHKNSEVAGVFASSFSRNSIHMLCSLLLGNDRSRLASVGNREAYYIYAVVKITIGFDGRL
jgi:hypothetical protein